MNVGYVLTEKAQQVPGVEAIVFEDKRFTYQDLNNRVNSFANALLDTGIKKNEHVALLLQNCNQFMEIYFALAKIGAVLVPINWRLAPQEIEYITNNSDAVALILGSDYIDTVNLIRNNLSEVRTCIVVGKETPSDMENYENLVEAYPTSEPLIKEEVGLEDDMCVIYTSGTTGRPKGAVHTHGSTLWEAVNEAIAYSINANDIALVSAPLFHVGGFHDLHFPLYYVGGKVILHRRFSEEEILADIAKEHVTLLFGVSSMIRRIAQWPTIGDYDLSSVRLVMTGGEPFAPKDIREVIKHFKNAEYTQVYGLTEGIALSTFLDGKHALEKIGSVGKPFYGVELRIIDEQGHAVPKGGTGEIIQKGTHMMRDYWKMPEEAGPTFDKDGWFHTGDLARIDEDGYIYIVGRIKDMIISGGENIYPAEIEGVLYLYPKIKEVAVIGIPDEKWGEAVKAIVVLKPGCDMTAEEVINHCTQRLARFKRPKSVVFVDALPKTASGKIAKAELRARHSKG